MFSQSFLSDRFSRGASLLFCLLIASFAGAIGLKAEEGFVSLFDGRSLDGWTLLGKKGEGYGVKNGVLFCTEDGGGNLLSKKTYSDFVFRFEFRLPPGGNNGIAIRAPFQSGSLAYKGMEVQVLDDTAEKYAKLEPGQYNGSVYKVIRAQRGALRPVGEWNRDEIRHGRIVLNGVVIVDADLDSIDDPKVLKAHPGIKNESGHIGFLGHNDFVEFRNIRMKEL